MGYTDKYPFNIESPQKLEILWSPDIVWDYDKDGYPTGNESLFQWKNEFMPYKTEPDGVTVFHVWMKYKIGAKGSWSSPMRVNYPTVVKGEKGEKGDVGEQGIIGNRGATGKNIEMQYADESHNIVAYNSSYAVFVRFRIEGEGWSTWMRVVGINGVGSGGTGLPVGGTAGQLLARTGVGYDWIDQVDVYNDTDAVNAMGAKADSNPLNHDRYTDAEALALVTATTPIDITAGVISHINTDGNKHIPAAGTQNYTITLDGSGNLVWVEALWKSNLDDSAGLGDTEKLYSADRITTLLAALSTYGIKFVVNLVTNLPVTGINDKDLALCNNESFRPVYIYDSAASGWNLYFYMDAEHSYDSLFYTKTELGTASSGAVVDYTNLTNVPNFVLDTVLATALTDYYTKTDLNTSAGIGVVHWDNLTGLPSFLELTDISATAPITYNSATGVIAHATTGVEDTTNTNAEVVKNIEFDNKGHVAAVTSKDLNADSTKLTALSGSFELIDSTTSAAITDNKYNPLDNGVSAETLMLNLESDSLSGTSLKPARTDHKHARIENQILRLSDSITGNEYDLEIEDGIVLSISEVPTSTGITFSPDTLTIKQNESGNTSVILAGGESGDTWNLDTFLPSGISLVPDTGGLGTTSSVVSVDSGTTLGTKSVNVYLNGGSTIMDTLVIDVIAGTATPATGSFSQSTVNASSGSNVSLTINFDAGTSSETGWDIVNKTGTDDSSFTPSSEHSASTTTSVTLSVLGDSGTTQVYALNSYTSGTELDTITINIT